MRYIQRIDGEPFEVRSDEVTRWSCCDCGLVHDIAFAARGDMIGVAARVNKRATAARRRSPSVAAVPQGLPRELPYGAMVAILRRLQDRPGAIPWDRLGPGQQDALIGALVYAWEDALSVASEPKAKSGRRDRSNGQVPGTQNPSPPGDPQ